MSTPADVHALTSPAPLIPQVPDVAEVRRRVAEVVHDFMRHKNDAAAASGFSPEVPNTVAEFLKAGGKRFRPLLCMLGWHATRSTGSVAQAVQVGAALETFHASCLIHDDLMDHSDTRRGQPAVHRALATRYRPDRTAAEDLGASVAIRPRTRQTGTARQFPRLVCRSR